MKELLKTIGLTKVYNSHTCVNNLNIIVKENRIYGFLGPNGAGKSTTLKMILGLVRPSRGEIDIFGKRMNPKNRIEILRNTGSLIESPSYYGHLTAKENLKILAELSDVPSANIDKVLSIVRLDKQQNKKTAQFSLGMKQRLGLAGALLSFPKLLILDEPTNGLDPAGIQEMRELIKSLPKQYGMTVIVSSHLLSEIDLMAEDIGIIANGKMMYQGELNRLHEMDNSKSLEEIFLDLTGKEQSL
ncbi:MAG: ATP-binding cassette domain-containing protein [bacterium]|nr:ATP-binding cassette domain-containing protein [bacterium]